MEQLKLQCSVVCHRQIEHFNNCQATGQNHVFLHRCIFKAIEIVYGCIFYHVLVQERENIVTQTGTYFLIPPMFHQENEIHLNHQGSQIQWHISSSNKGHHRMSNSHYRSSRQFPNSHLRNNIMRSFFFHICFTSKIYTSQNSLRLISRQILNSCFSFYKMHINKYILKL